MSLRLAINGYGLVGRHLAARLQNVPWVQLVAVNEVAERTAAERAVLGPAVQWLREPSPERLPWRALAIAVVIEAARFFARAELEAQIASSSARILMTGDLRTGLPDLTLVPTINGATLTPAHRIIGLGSDRTQCLLPLLHVLDAAFGLAKANIVLERPPYVGRAWGMLFQDADRQRASEQFERVLPGFGNKMQLVRVESPHATLARFSADVQLTTPPEAEHLRRVLTLDSANGQQVLHVVEGEDRGAAGACRVFGLRLRQSGNRVWLEGEYDPLGGYVERIVDCLALVAGVGAPTLC